jgi:DNA-binding MarR family transcriptional regulator
MSNNAFIRTGEGCATFSVVLYLALNPRSQLTSRQIQKRFGVKQTAVKYQLRSAIANGLVEVTPGPHRTAPNTFTAGAALLKMRAQLTEPAMSRSPEPRRRVMAHLEANGPCTAAAVAEAIGKHTCATSRLVRVLAAEGLVETAGYAEWNKPGLAPRLWRVAGEPAPQPLPIRREAPAGMVQRAIEAQTGLALAWMTDPASAACQQPEAA